MMDRQEERWHRCKASIGQRISAEDAATWLSPLQLQDVQPHRVVLGGIPNAFFRHRIDSRFRPLILESLRDSFPDLALDGEAELELRVGNGGPERAAAPAPRPAADTADGGEDEPAASDGADRQRLDNFVSAPGNAEALSFAQQVLEQPGRRFNPLLLVGPTGMGKSHLLHGIAHGLRERHGLQSVVTVTGDAFKNEVLDGITRKRMPAVRERLRTAQALLLDDLEFLLVSPKAQEELLHTFDVLHRAGRQLVFTSGRFPRALTGLSDALRSRMEMGLIAELAPPDEAARLAVVRQRAAHEGLALGAEVEQLLARRITRNLRRLEGAVIRLGAHAALNGRTVTVDFAERFAAPFFDAERPESGLPVSRETILERVADRFGITVRALRGRSRSPNITSARRVAVHLLKALGECSYSEMGTLLGNRSHSTMVHAHQTLRADLERDANLLRAVQQLQRELIEH